MGIRPQFYILVGIDDAIKGDPRYVGCDPDLLEELLNFRDMTHDEMWKDGDLFDDWVDAEHFPGRSRNLSDLIYNPELTDEFPIGRVIGYIIHKGAYNDDILRAFAAIDEKYLSSGCHRIPTIDPDKHSLIYRHYGYTDEDIRCNRFVSGVFESLASISRNEWKRAQHYLRMVGWEVPEEDLRYLLAWNWS